MSDERRREAAARRAHRPPTCHLVSPPMFACLPRVQARDTARQALGLPIWTLGDDVEAICKLALTTPSDLTAQVCGTRAHRTHTARTPHAHHIRAYA